MGEGYRHAAAVGGETGCIGLNELDDHAARTRLECYRYFGCTSAPGGGEPTLTPGAAKVTRDSKKAQAILEEHPNFAQPVLWCFR